MATVAPATPTSSYLAGSLLRAWVQSDLAALETELDKSSRIFLSSALLNNEAEEERLELLQSVAGWMRACPNLLAANSEDPGLDLCVDLLVHLAGLVTHSD